MTVTDWTRPGADDQPIFGNTHTPDGEPVGVLLICHGFKGYKDYGFFPRLADAAAGRGLIAHRFNFSHSGMTPRTETFERPDLFEQDTWMKQVRDLHTVAAAVASGKLAGQGLPGVWFGHSRGGVAVLLAASGTEPAPVGVVTAAAPDKACNLEQEQQRLLKKLGRMPSPSGRTGQELYVGRRWLEEIEADPDAHDPCRAIAALPCPALILHGDADPTVDPSAARRLADAAPGRATLRLIPEASHTFNAPNPLPPTAPLPEATRTMIELTCDFAVERCTAIQDN